MLTEFDIWRTSVSGMRFSHFTYAGGNACEMTGAFADAGYKQSSFVSKESPLLFYTRHLSLPNDVLALSIRQADPGA